MSFSLPISMRFAIRSLARNSRRSLLSIIGIAVGCSVALGEVAMTRGKIEMYIRNIAEGGVGHFRISPKGWQTGHDPALRLSDWQNELAQARQTPGVRAATPRSRLQAMLAMGTHMSGVEIVGVDPRSEPSTFRYVREIQSGRYLREGDSHQMVIGKSIADRLKVDIGDPVVVTAVSAAGSGDSEGSGPSTAAIRSEMFDIIGIVDLGSRALEASICQVTLKDLESLSGLKGAGEIAIVLEKPDLIQSVMDQIRPVLPAADVLLSWGEIRPDSRIAVEINEVMAKFFTGILVFVAFVGVASAQLTAILERQKEFAVLSAIGMGSKRIVALVLSEALVLGTLSWILTLVLSGPLIYHFAKVGFRVLEKSQSLSAVGASIDPIFHLDFGSWFFVYAAFLCYFSTIAASIYPAYFTAKLNPADALRVAQ